jgi:hypothetical protein
MQTSASSKNYGSISTNSYNNSEIGSNILTNGIVNKSYVVTSGEFFLVCVVILGKLVRV